MGLGSKACTTIHLAGCVGTDNMGNFVAVSCVCPFRLWASVQCT